MLRAVCLSPAVTQRLRPCPFLSLCMPNPRLCIRHVLRSLGDMNGQPMPFHRNSTFEVQLYHLRASFQVLICCVELVIMSKNCDDQSNVHCPNVSCTVSDTCQVQAQVRATTSLQPSSKPAKDSISLISHVQMGMIAKRWSAHSRRWRASMLAGSCSTSSCLHHDTSRCCRLVRALTLSGSL